MNAFIESYYGQPAAAMRDRQAYFGGPAGPAAAWLKGYVDAGASHLIVRFAGDHERQLDAIAGLRARFG